MSLTVDAIAPQERRAIFRDVLRIRLIEEAVADRYPEQEMRCPVHLSIGQEGVAVGVCRAIAPSDYVMSTHRPHAHYLAKGGSLRAMIAEFYGKATGCCAGRGGSMHLIDLECNMLGSTPIVGSSLPVAVGTAFGTWQQDRTEVTVVFFGDGATEEGTFQESLNFAALKALPVLFVCENNLYSVYTSLEIRQAPGRDRMGIAEANGVRAFAGDGNDAEAVYELTRTLAERARSGGGPAYLELDTYRWREHCGPAYDNHLGYRTEEEFLAWKQRDPVATLQVRLEREGLLRAGDVETMTAEIHEEIEDAFTFAKASPYPPPEDLFAGIYSNGRSC